MKKKVKYSKKDYKKLAAKLSGEEPSVSGGADNIAADEFNTEKYWKEIGMMNNSKEIDVDNAWNNVINRIEENGLLTETPVTAKRIGRNLFLKIAAVAVILVAIGSVLINIFISGDPSNITVASDNDQKDIVVSLPDGSKAWLNRSSELSYSSDHGKETRNVKLTGEAFFEVTPDEARPFIIDAGDARIKVVGTSFNVISRNKENNVEVYVLTGKVMLSDPTGNNGILLEPEDIGTKGSGDAVSVKNENLNYLSWKTDLLIYEGVPLDVVFNDLKRVYNINVSVDDPEILKKTITATYDKEPQDTIIDLICTTFTLSYDKDGYNYRLYKR